MAVSPKKLVLGKEEGLGTVGLDTNQENNFWVFITCTF